MRVWWKHDKGPLILEDGVNAFYINGLLRAFVFAMVSIFTPVYIYTQAITVWGSMQSGLIAVAGFFLVQKVAILLVAIPVSKIIEQIGFRRSVFISVVLCVVYMATLTLVKYNFHYTWLAAILLAVNVPFYWIARDSALSQDASKKEMGRSMAGIAVLEKIASISGPFVAGVIIVTWGFGTLFALSLILLAISALPVAFMPHHTHRNGVSLTGFWWWITGRRYFHQAIAQAGQAMEDYGLTAFWPMALYLIGFQAGTLGIMFSGLAIVTLVIQLGSGVLFDRLRRKGNMSDEIVFGFATIGTAVIWLVRLFIFTVFQVVIVDSIGQIFQTVYYGFQSDYLHLGGKRMGSIAFWVYGEMIYSISAIGIFSLLIVGVYFGIWKELTFLTIAMWVVFSLVQARESNLK
jgi:MFS family permease